VSGDSGGGCAAMSMRETEGEVVVDACEVYEHEA
jgi:hypothetical protein